MSDTVPLLASSQLILILTNYHLSYGLPGDKRCVNLTKSSWINH